MGKCTVCRKADELYTPWERFRRFFFHLFNEDIQDLSGDQFTKGFGRGYEAGFKHAQDFEAKYQELYEKISAGSLTQAPINPQETSDGS